MIPEAQYFRDSCSNTHRFFHPDYTVGMGITPIHTENQPADYTASEELHLALKQTFRDKYTVSLFVLSIVFL